MRWWKVLGLAGMAGVAATGVVVARDQRRRSRMTPDEVRDRLRRRLDEADDRSRDGADGADGATGTDRPRG